MPFLFFSWPKKKNVTGKGRGVYVPDQQTFSTVFNRETGERTVTEARGAGACRGTMEPLALANSRGIARATRGGGRSSGRGGFNGARSPRKRRAPGGAAGAERDGDWRDDGVRVTDGLVLFWHSPACFAQWTPVYFEIDGVHYCNAEQWMMASKARLFNDSEMLAKIMATDDPRKHKALGRKVRGFDPVLWDDKGFDLVVQGNLAKFRQNEVFKQELLATGDKILAEASPYDKVWGIGLSAKDPRALVQQNWQGTNKLGEALMDVRRILKEDVLAETEGEWMDVEGVADEALLWHAEDTGAESFDEDQTIGNHRGRKCRP